MNLKLYFLYFLGIFYLNNIFPIKSSTDLNTNSIIKIFCLESVKSEMVKAKINYKESFGDEVCDCYLKNINNNMTHERSIKKCKMDVNKQKDLYLKE